MEFNTVTPTEMTWAEFRIHLKGELRDIVTHVPEKDRLRVDVKWIDPHDKNLCIYGLMFGSCDDAEAVAHYRRCIPMVLDAAGNNCYDPFQLSLHVRNWNDRELDLERFPIMYTPIEIYLMTAYASGQPELCYDFVSLIHGETDKIEHLPYLESLKGWGVTE